MLFLLYISWKKDAWVQWKADTLKGVKVGISFLCRCNSSGFVGTWADIPDTMQWFSCDNVYVHITILHLWVQRNCALQEYRIVDGESLTAVKKQRGLSWGSKRTFVEKLYLTSQSQVILIKKRFVLDGPRVMSLTRFDSCRGISLTHLLQLLACLERSAYRLSNRQTSMCGGRV